MSDIRGITIAFAGDTTDIDQKFTKLKGQAKDFGLELEQVTKKIGSVQTVTSTLLGADGKNIVTTFANVNAELKLVAPNAEKAIEALKDLQELNLKQGGSLGIARIGAAQGTAGFDAEAYKLEKKRQDKLLEFHKETLEKRRLLTLNEAFKESDTLKRINLLRQEEELQAKRKHEEKLAEIKDKLENPTGRYNKGHATQETNRELDRYAKEREQIRLTAQAAIDRYNNEQLKIKQLQEIQKQTAKDQQTQRQLELKQLRDDIIARDRLLREQAARRAEAFGTVSGRQSQVAKTSAIGGTDNNLVTMRANIAQQEIEIERRKNQKLLGLEIALQKDKIALVRANERRNIILQNYEQELTDLQAQKNKLRALEVKSTKSAGGYGLNFGDMAARVLEINVLWNAINKLNAAVSNAVSSIIPLGIQLDATKASLQSTAGGTAATTEILQALTTEAQRTGIEISNLRQNFRLFQASTSLAGASMEKTWKMFTDLNTVSAALHLTTDQTNSVFLAMAQIFNKGKVQAEELVRQLGNLLPGAFASFAAANNMTTQKLIEQMEKGRVYAQDTMEKFTNFMATRFSGAFATASQALNADIGRMNTEFQLLGEGLYQIVRGPVQSFIQSLTAATQKIRESTTQTTSLNTAFSAIKIAIDTGIAVSLFTLIKRLSETLAAAKLLETGTAFLRNPALWVGAIAAIGASIYELTNHLRRGSDAANDFLEKQIALDKVARQGLQPAPLRIAAEIDKAPQIVELRTKIQEAQQVLRKLESPKLDDLQKFDIAKINTLITQLKEAYEGAGDLLQIHAEDARELAKGKLVKYYQVQLQYLNEKLRLESLNLQKEKEGMAAQEQKAAVTNEFGEKQEVKRLDQIKARLAEAEYQKTVAEQANDFDKVARINREILNLERQKTEETKKGSEVAEKIKKIYEDIETLGKRDKEKGLNASEKQRLAELTTELAQLREVQRGFNAEVDKAALLEQARLKQKQTTQINKELPLYTDEAKTAIEEAKTALAEQTTRYKEHKISLYEYYESVRTLRTAMVNEEITAHQKRMELMTADDERRKQEVERIRELEQEKKTIAQEVAQSFNKDLNEVSSIINDINTKYLESVGKYGEAGLSKAQEAQREQIATLESIQAVLREDLANPDEPILAKDTEQAQKFLTVANQVTDALQKLKTISFDAQAEGFFKEFQNKEQFLNKDLAIKEIILRTKQKSGAITEFGALLERQQNMQDYIPKMQEEIQKLEDRIMAAKGSADEATLGSVEKWRQELNEKKALLAEFAASSELIADRFQTIFTEAFGTAFANFVTGTTTAAEAFQNFAKSVIASLANIAAQEMASQIFSIFKTAVGGIAGGGDTLTAGNAITSIFGYSKGGIPAFDSSNSFFEDFKNKVNFASGGIPDIGSVKQTFMMANGGVGTLRERGPEAILPLQRDSKGNLGVSATQTTNNEGGLQIGNIQINVENKKEESGPDLANTIAETLVRRLADEQIQKASRPGNLLNKTTRFGNG